MSSVIKGSAKDHKTHIYTDGHDGYLGLEPDYVHQIVDHAIEYVNGNVSTNGVENFWTLLKRSIKGTYVSVEPFHLFRYVDEQAFRYNNRKDKDGDRFLGVAANMVGKRVTYRKLTGKLREKGNEKQSEE